jgi:[protein-PII] uridylyltransferase
LSLPAFPRTEEVDRAVKTAAAEFLDGGISSAFALLAVGGYGRRELFPFSDVDLLLLVEQEPDLAKLKEPLSQLLRFLWDSSVSASHSVRTVDECCRIQENNVHLSVSLLDVRFLCGSMELFEKLEQRLANFFRRQAKPLLQSLADLTSGRHTKFGNTVYHLEPNIKETPGGIRDVHFLHWAALLAPNKEPLRHAVSEVQGARDFLYRLRFFLHERHGRDNNLLSYELQDEAARRLPPQPQAPEEWMRGYYRHARSCFQPALQALDFIGRGESGLFRQFMDRRDRFSTADFTVSHNRAFMRNPAGTLRSPLAAFELFLFIGRHGVRLSWDSERRLMQRLPAFEGASSNEQPTWKEWRMLLSQPHAALALRDMQGCGMLTFLFPEWSAVESLVVRDFYHRYTVDEHSVVAIEAIDNLLVEDAGGSARFRQLALEEDNLAILRMALLLHDVGKGTTPGDHVRGSLEMAEVFLTRIEMPQLEKLTVEFLVRHHLDLSSVMTSRDLDDPATSRYLSSQIGTYEDLRKLTLLTYADVSAVNPTAMTPWRLEQLWRVYSVTAAQLTKELDSQRISHSPESPVIPLARPELARFLEGFPTRYLRIHSPEQIEEHYRLEQLRLREGLALDIRHEPGAYSMTVLAADRSGLFASLCGALASFGMNIVKAEAASNAAGCALDEFHFTDPSRTLELNPDEVERLRWTVECVIRGVIEVRDLLKRRRAPHRPYAAARVPAAARFDPLASNSATLLQFTGEDRPGLLFDLASILTEAGCDIELVLVHTEANRAIDVFYLTKSGGKLAESAEEALRQQLENQV